TMDTYVDMQEFTWVGTRKSPYWIAYLSARNDSTMLVYEVNVADRNTMLDPTHWAPVAITRWRADNRGTVAKPDVVWVHERIIKGGFSLPGPSMGGFAEISPTKLTPASIAAANPTVSGVPLKTLKEMTLDFTFAQELQRVSYFHPLIAPAPEGAVA